MLSAIFVTKTIPLEIIHVQKTFFHYLRRIEYFSLFFIMFTAIRNPKIVKVYFYLFMLAVAGVIIYGFGQKYLYWPAFSTMNREFSKGWRLYLTEHSRVLSTFGGHYDLAAYLMMMLTIQWSIFFSIKNKLFKIFLFIILGATFWTLILTASRASFIAYLCAVSVVVLLWIFRKSIPWMFSRWFIVVALSIFAMLSFGDLSDRFAQILRIEQRFGGLKQILLRPAVKPPTDRALFLANNLNAVTARSDQPLTPDKNIAQRPVDVTEDIPIPIPSATDSSVLINNVRTYSESAIRYDLSTGIRLDALWPMAIRGFLKNPFLGSGYSTLNKTQVNEFTEAESTDNDYLRMLGETGALGTLSYLSIIFIAIYTIWKYLHAVKDQFWYGIFVGVIGLTFGLLINAVYIDVFEASKVAYSYWAVMGLTLGAVAVKKDEFDKIHQPLKINFNFQSFKKSVVTSITSDKFLLVLVLLLAFYLRLYRIDSPVADWHSWRQADTAAVTRNFERNGINMLYPTFDDLSSIPSGKANPRGLRMVEFPLYNAASVIVKKIIPEGPLERSMRLTSIFVSLGTLIFIFLLVRKYTDRLTSFITAITFAVLPYNIFYGRVILPEPTLVFLSIGSIYFFDSYVASTYTKSLKSVKYYVLTAIFAALSLLIKPFAIFILLLPILYIALRSWGIAVWKRKELYLLVLVVVLPFIFWRIWIQQFPEGIPAYDWLFNGDNIRFKGAFFYWLFAERISKLILGYWGLFLLLVGIAAHTAKREGWIFRLLLLGSLGYLFTIATGNVRHDYYQVLLIPVICIYVGKGVAYLFRTNLFQRKTSILLAILAYCFMLAFGWYQVRDLFNINHPEIVKAGEAANKLLPRKSLVIAPYFGDTAFLYQTNRAGWPIVEGSIQNMINKGAQYYISVNFDDLTNEILSNSKIKEQYLDGYYTLIDKTDNYVIVQLVPNFQLPKD